MDMLKVDINIKLMRNSQKDKQFIKKNMIGLFMNMKKLAKQIFSMIFL